MSYPILYAINNGKTSEAKRMLSYNLVNLVLNYDKDVFLNTSTLPRLCDDWNNDMKNIVLKTIEKKAFENTTYQQDILKNIDLINSDCRRNKGVR